MTVTVSLTHDPAELTRLGEEWVALQARAAASVVFLTWEWVSTWWDYYGQQGELWLFQARADDGHLVGLGPLMLAERRPVPLVRWRQLQFIGASSACDHLDFIIEAGCEREVLDAFLAAIQRERARWDVLYLSSLPSYSPTFDLLQANGLPWQEEEPFTCPIVTLPDGWEAFHEALGKRKRKNIRRAHRKLDDEMPDRWTWDRVADPAELDGAMDAMIEMHQAKWRALGKPGGFPDENTVAFHHAAARRLLAEDRLWLYRLWIGGQLAAVEYAYRYGDRVYAYASGINFELADYSPGQMLTEIMIEQAIQAGVREYDFLRGDEEYKFFWGAENRPDRILCWIASPRARLEQRAIEGTRALWGRVKGLLPRRWRRRLSHAVTHE